ncbi:hypothetical protein DFH94DRAFT_184057 [Russula ochroleuca]|uniref:Uncharacterized protein n=1 Tax=Russula ochroleuca TaxID=152965 RepID=A0A9P5N5G8_9AGAM|nr:hypothetical protein DFH94DRAFT_184057 [Russula ochroleuca]
MCSPPAGSRAIYSLVRVFDDLARFPAVRGCGPDQFYPVIRPWFNGTNSGSRKWTFEGFEERRVTPGCVFRPKSPVRAQRSASTVVERKRSLFGYFDT